MRLQTKILMFPSTISLSQRYGRISSMAGKSSVNWSLDVLAKANKTLQTQKGLAERMKKLPLLNKGLPSNLCLLSPLYMHMILIVVFTPSSFTIANIFEGIFCLYLVHVSSSGITYRYQ